MTPRKLNQKLIVEIADLIERGYALPEVCVMVDVSIESIRSWRKVGRAKGSGLCYQLDMELNAIEKRREAEQLARKQQILSHKISKLHEKYGPA